MSAAPGDTASPVLAASGSLLAEIRVTADEQKEQPMTKFPSMNHVALGGHRPGYGGEGRLMPRSIVRATVGALTSLAIVAGTAKPSGAGPTCAATVGIAVHGQHIVNDYVTGEHGDWPPAGSVGESIAGSGAQTPGGPGPGFHFPNGFAPGASFCLNQSRSPGFHPGQG